MLLLLVGCLLAICNGQVPAPEVKTPKYEAFYDSICPYGEESFKVMDTSGVNIDRISDTSAVVSGVLELKEALPEKSILSLVVYKVMASGKEEVYQTLNVCDLCKEMADPDSSYRSKLDKFGLPQNCPVNPGNYSISDLCFDVNELVAMSAQTLGPYIVEMMFCYATGDNCQQDRVCSCFLRVLLTVEDTA